MRTPWVGRGVACVAVALLTVVIAGAPTSASPGQELPPITVVPPLPDELDPITGAISPVMWQACNSVGLAVGLIVLSGTLLGVPPDVGVPLNEAIATVSGPVLLIFFEVCQQIPLPEQPPDCETDLLLPLLPSLGRPILPAALLANQLRALDTALQTAGLPLDGALGDAADDLLDCAAGRNPEPDAPTPAPEPDLDPDASTPPLVDAGGTSSGGAAPPRAPGGGATATTSPVAPEKAPVSELPLAVAQPITSSDGGTGTGLAMALLGLAVLAVLGWLHAGNPRSGRAPAAEIVMR